MHDTDANSPSLQPAAHAERAMPMPQTARAGAKAAPARAESKKPGLLARFFLGIARLFSRKAPPAKNTSAQELVACERAAVSHAAQLPPPLAFKGETANTLASPLPMGGAYAGKPLDQAMRKRAEQQFREFDVTKATMN